MPYFLSFDLPPSAFAAGALDSLDFDSVDFDSAGFESLDLDSDDLESDDLRLTPGHAGSNPAGHTLSFNPTRQ